jgi:hypothetical protein
MHAVHASTAESLHYSGENFFYKKCNYICCFSLVGLRYEYTRYTSSVICFPTQRVIRSALRIYEVYELSNLFSYSACYSVCVTNIRGIRAQ